MFRIALAALALCVLTPSLAQAQLYSWKDADGRLIIDIGYRVRATNNMRNLVYPFYVIPAEELE